MSDGLLGTVGAVKNVEPLLADALLGQSGDSYLLMNYWHIWRYLCSWKYRRAHPEHNHWVRHEFTQK